MSFSNKNKKIIWISLIVLLIISAYIAFYGTFYGALTLCSYSEKILDIPPDLKNSTFVLEKHPAFVVLGDDPDPSLCSKTLSKITRYILEEKARRNSTVTYPMENFEGRTIEEIPQGTSFTIEAILLKHPRGIISRLPDAVPLTFVILRDDAGNLYMTNPSQLYDSTYDESPALFSRYLDGVEVEPYTFKDIQFIGLDRLLGKIKK